MHDDFRIYIQIHLEVTLKAINVSYAFKLNKQKEENHYNTVELRV